MGLKSLFSLFVAAAIVVPATTLTPAEWRSQSIYQVMTDRFARTDLSTSYECKTSQQIYCGGTWKGLISKLDYIQGMGFTAIWISPYVEQMSGNTSDGSSYHVSTYFSSMATSDEFQIDDGGTDCEDYRATGRRTSMPSTRHLGQLMTLPTYLLLSMSEACT